MEPSRKLPEIQVSFRSEVDQIPSASDSLTALANLTMADIRRGVQIQNKEEPMSKEEKLRLALQKRKEEIEDLMNQEMDFQRKNVTKISQRVPPSPQKAVQLADLMLDHVLALEQSHLEYFQTSGNDLTNLEINPDLYEGSKYLLCVKGRSIVFGSRMTGFPNSFANPESLHDPKSDLAGYLRFLKRVNMSGFTDEEISMELIRNRIKIVGVRRKESGLGGKKVEEEIVLPSGVYPDKLLIARSQTGELLLQEMGTFP